MGLSVHRHYLRGSSSHLARIFALKRQSEPEGAPFAGGAGHADGATVTLDDVLTNVQSKPQANARPALLLHTWHAIKTLEEMRLLSGGEARPLIAHLHPHHVTLNANGNGDRRLIGRVFERIRRQVRDHLTNAIRVGVDRDYRATRQD